MIVVKAPNPYRLQDKLIFLAGSIEMGRAEDWQSKVAEALKDTDYTLLNPRRDDWNPEALQTISDPYFNTQVNWELDGIETADTIIFYFDPATISPITLLELGKVSAMADYKHVLVCCPDGYFRKGNVEIVCHRANIPLFNTLDELLENL